MTAVAKQPVILLNCLERFEKQVGALTNQRELVELFCRDIIPFLENHEGIKPLRNEWRLRRDFLNQCVQKTEEQALVDVQDVFRKIKAVNTTNELISQEIILIDELLTGRKKWFGTPLYRVIYNKLRKLFQLLLEAGFLNLCEPYAKLAYHKKYVQKGADYELVEEAYIEEFLFAPSVIDAYDAMDAAQCCKDPAVIWWYFEHAQWCWRTPESYFSQTITCKNSKKNKNLFLASCERSVWREIAAVRDHSEINSVPVIFTKELFQNGFSVLINAISAYVSNGSGHRASQAPAKPVTTFELMLEENELWIKVIFENRSTEKFCVQKFNEGVGGEESALFKFVKGIFTSPRAGEKRAKLRYKWETASKHIERIKLPVGLKKEFFKKPHSSSFIFGGLRVQLSSNVDDVLSELHEEHLKKERL